jgi:DUF971 family protein
MSNLTNPETPDVVDVTIERSESVTITFDDGLVCVFGVGELRAQCPCATCRGIREHGTPSWPRPGQSPQIAIRDAKFSGAWGVSITWSDGHDTGIYAWANLRRWWENGLDQPFTDGPPFEPPFQSPADAPTSFS